MLIASLVSVEASIASMHADEPTAALEAKPAAAQFFDEPTSAPAEAEAAAAPTLNELAVTPEAPAAVQVFDFLNLEASFVAVLALIFFHAFWSGRKPPRRKQRARGEAESSSLRAEPLGGAEELDHGATNAARNSKPAIPQSRPPTSAVAAARAAAVEPILTTIAEAPLQCEPRLGPEGALPPKVAEGVRELRTEVGSRLETWSSAVRAEAEAQMDDLTLGRWVVAFPQGAASAFESGMTWRAANRVSQLTAELHPLARTREGRTARQAAVQEYGYAGLGGLTRDGLPYVIERLGKADFGGYARQGEAMMQLMREAYIVHLELMTRTVRAAGAATGTFAMGLVVIDTKGVGASLLFNLALVKFAAKVGPPQPPCNPSP